MSDHEWQHFDVAHILDCHVTERACRVHHGQDFEFCPYCSAPLTEDKKSPIEDANDQLAEALRHANVYASHDQVRPSAVRAFDKVEDAHRTLTEIDVTRHD